MVCVVWRCSVGVVVVEVVVVFGGCSDKCMVNSGGVVVVEVVVL